MSELSSKAKKLFDEFSYSQTVYHAYSAIGIDNEYIEMKRKTRDAKRESFEEYVVGLESRIAELEAENKKAFDFVKTLRTYCIYAHWDNQDTEGEFNEFDAEICKWLSEFTEREK